MRRRQFLRTSAAAAGGLAVLGSAPAPRMSSVPERLGVQLYTLRDVFPHDFMGVLDTLARMGYREVEFAGYHDRAPSAVRGALDSAGLTAPSAHVQLEELERNLDAVLEAAAVVGHRYVVLPSLPEDRRRSLDDYHRLAETFNRLGERARRASVGFAYHNHAFEFETFGGGRPAFDVLLEETDPAHVAFEMDLYWVTAAGHDPLAYVQRYPGRFPLVHLKDSAGAPDHTMREVGRGVIDFPAFLARAERAGLRHVFVEHDEPEDGLASVRASYRYLAGLRG